MCKGLHTCFWEEGRGRLFISLLSSLPQDTSTYFISLDSCKRKKKGWFVTSLILWIRKPKENGLMISPERENNQHKPIGKFGVTYYRLKTGASSMWENACGFECPFTSVCQWSPCSFSRGERAGIGTLFCHGGHSKLPCLLQRGGGPKHGLLSNTRKWVVRGDTHADKARDFIGKGCSSRERLGKGTQKDCSATWLTGFDFMVMGLVLGCLWSITLTPSPSWWHRHHSAKKDSS